MKLGFKIIVQTREASYLLGDVNSEMSSVCRSSQASGLLFQWVNKNKFRKVLDKQALGDKIQTLQ